MNDDTNYILKAKESSMLIQAISDDKVVVQEIGYQSG